MKSGIVIQHNYSGATINLFSKNDIDNLSNDIKIYEKKKNKYDISSIIYFLLTSGSKIDINQIINAIKN